MIPFEIIESEYLDTDETGTPWFLHITKKKLFGITVFEKTYNTTNLNKISEFTSQSRAVIGFKNNRENDEGEE